MSNTRELLAILNRLTTISRLVHQRAQQLRYGFHQSLEPQTFQVS